MKKNLVGLLVLLFLLGVLIGGCGSGGEKSTGEDSSGSSGDEAIQIGAVLDISGGASSLGVPERNTLKMLAEQLNKEGGINGRPVELTILDNKSDETQAVLAAKKIIEKDVLAILGCSASGTSMAMLDTVQKAEVPMISLAAASSIVAPAEERKWVFKTAQSDIVTVTNIINYLKEKGIDKVAFMYMNNSYGDGGKKTFTSAAKENDIEIVVNDKFEASDKDMTPQLTRVKSSEAQALIIWAIPPSASIVTKNFDELGISIPLIHSHGVGNQKFLDLARDAADGVILPIGKMTVASQIPQDDPQKEVLEKYISDYQEKYGKKPDSFGGYAYDAFYLLVNAIEKAGTDKEAIRDQLENTSELVGVSGIFNMSSSDHNGLDDESMVMVQVKDGEWKIIE